MKKRLKKKEFASYELSEEAFAVYSDSDFTFYYDYLQGAYWMAFHKDEEPTKMGTLDDVEHFLKNIYYEYYV